MASNPLFELIQSLSPSEKGYIKKTAFSLREGMPIYIQLLDAISKQTIYDELKIRDKFSDVLSSKNFFKCKNDLYNLILKKLAQYHEDKTIEIKLKNLLSQGIILHKKGLYELAINQYDKVLKLALENEELLVALEVYQKLLSIYYAGRLGVTFPHNKALDELNKKLFKEKDVYNLQTRIAEILFSDHLSEKDILKEVENILCNDKLKEINDQDSFISQWGAKCVKSHAYYLLKKFDKANKCNKLQLEFLRLNHKVSSKEPMRLVKHINNYINGKFNVSAYDEIPELLKELKDIKINKTLYKYIEPLQYSCLYIHQLSYYTQTGDFESGIKVLPEINNWFEINKTKVSDYFLMLFYSEAFTIHFGLKDYKKALQFLNLLINNKTEFRKELQLSVKFYYIILHFELENHDLVSSMLKSLERYIFKYFPHLEQELKTSKWLPQNIETVFNKKSLAKQSKELYQLIKSEQKDEVWNLMYLPFLMAWLKANFKPGSFSSHYSMFFQKK